MSAPTDDGFEGEDDRPPPRGSFKRSWPSALSSGSGMKRSCRCADLTDPTRIPAVPLRRSGLSGELDDLMMRFGARDSEEDSPATVPIPTGESVELTEDAGNTELNTSPRPHAPSERQ